MALAGRWRTLNIDEHSPAAPQIFLFFFWGGCTTDRKTPLGGRGAEFFISENRINFSGLRSLSYFVFPLFCCSLGWSYLSGSCLQTTATEPRTRHWMICNGYERHSYHRRGFNSQTRQHMNALTATDNRKLSSRIER